MNRLTSQQRKLVYLGGIVALLIPIILLGAPATGEEGSGGTLAKLKSQNDLGESDLGDVDPTSATMNLVLLGMRGVAANLLWLQHDHYKTTKDWARMRAATDSIIKLQPHFIQVWRFHSWNLAYNVSVEWDSVADRYYWVKEGGKFGMDGVLRNQHNPELPWAVGRILREKIGRADEWRYYRKYFLTDPDVERFDGGPDPEFNREGKDNYLAAKTWYQLANTLEQAPGARQHIMARVIFRHYPVRSQMDYATALQREGIFEEKTQLAWQTAFDEWTKDYGQEEFDTPGGKIRLETRSEEEIARLAAEQDADVDELRRWLNSYQNMTNYRYWRTKAQAESDEAVNAQEAHRELYEGRELFKEGRTANNRFRPVSGVCEATLEGRLSEEEIRIVRTLCEADRSMTLDALSGELALEQGPLRETLEGLESRKIVERTSEAAEKLESGMRKYERMIDKFEDLKIDDQAIEEGLMAVLYWRYIHKLNGTTVPADYPLKRLWDAEQDRRPQLEMEFRRDAGL